MRSNGQIKVAGQAMIDGDASGETVEIDGADAKITGEISEDSQKINPRCIGLFAGEGAVAENNDNEKLALKNGKLQLSSKKTVTITSGTYYLNGINVTAKAKLNIEGEVRIFCTGKITVAANAEVNYEGEDYGLIILCNTNENVNISGSGDMRGIIYAPESFVHVSGQGLTVGNVFAKRVDVTGQGIIVGTGKEKTGGRRIMSAGRNPKPSALASFALGAVYGYPNPAKRANPTIHIECGTADKVEIRIYTIAAELVQAAEITGAPQLKNGKLCYEYTWDSRGKASGVYLYLVRCHRAGYGTLKTLKKLAIIK